MRKKVISLLITLSMVVCMMPCVATAAVTEGDIAINETNFPDANFRDYVVNRIDSDGNGSLSAIEINNVDIIYCNSKEIADLKGIEYFTSLVQLFCNENSLTSLDLSQNIKLAQLVCNGNEIKTLKLSGCTALFELDCRANNLETLDLSENIALESLDCSDNKLTALELNNNTKLKKLECRSNLLRSLVVDKCKALATIECNDNQLTTLNVSGNPALTSIACYSNQLTSLYLGRNEVLNFLDCRSNRLSSLNVRNNTALKTLECQDNQLKTLDLINNTALSSLNCSNNQLKTLEVFSKSLETLYCGGNALTSLYIGTSEKLNNLNCESNQLTSLNVSKDISLKNLNCNDNQLRTLDVSGNTAIEVLQCNKNSIESLDVSNNTKLTSLSCDENRLASLDLSKNTALKDLSCKANKCTAMLDIGSEGKYNLSNLPGDFKASDMTNWTGGTVLGNILTFNENSDTVTYQQGPFSCITSGEPYITFTLQKYQRHEHEYGEWKPKGNGWHIQYCIYGCGSHKESTCRGGEATAQEQAICEVCGQPYGKYLPGAATISGTDVLKKQGKEVVVDLNLNANTGLASMLVQLDYDKNVLEFISAENGEVFDVNSFIGPQEKTEGQGESEAKTLYWQNGTLTENVTKTGKLATLKFKIKDDAAVGKTKIRFLCDGGKYEAIDAKGDVVIVTANDATVEVVDFYYGDIDGNDKIDVSDVLRLRRYFAKWNGYTINPKAADLDSDGQTTLRDVTILERYIAGWRGYENLPMLDSPLPIA